MTLDFKIFSKLVDIRRQSAKVLRADFKTEKKVNNLICRQRNQSAVACLKRFILSPERPVAATQRKRPQEHESNC